MSDQAEHQGVTADAETEAAVESPGEESGAEQHPAEEARADEQQAEEASVVDGARSRRPSSLRLPTDLTGRLPHRKVLPSSFPSSPVFPGSPVQPPVSEPEEAGKSGQVPNFVSSLRDKLPTTKFPTGRLPTGKFPTGKFPSGKLPIGKLPTPKLPTGKVPADKLSTEKLPTDKLPVDRAKSLLKERPEVGLGIAFVGGLVIATMIKRLGRR